MGPAEYPANGDPSYAPPGTFYSLGIKGELVLEYENLVCNTNGADFDLDLREITYTPPDPRYPDEIADVYVSPDGENYTLAKSNVNRDALIAIPSSLRAVKFVKVVDQTDPKVYAKRKTPGDGIDIDGIAALNTTCDPGDFTCEASALRIEGGGPGGLVPVLIEPSQANTNSTSCASDSDSVVDFAGFTPLGLTTGVLTAQTTLQSSDPQAESEAEVVDFGMTTPAGITADVLTANAEGRCDGLKPELSGSSQVVGGSVQGQGFAGSQSETIPLGPLGTVYFNRQITEDTSDGKQLTQRALEIDLTPSAGYSVVVAEAIADYHNQPCLQQ